MPRIPRARSIAEVMAAVRRDHAGSRLHAGSAGKRRSRRRRNEQRHSTHSRDRDMLHVVHDILPLLHSSSMSCADGRARRPVNEDVAACDGTNGMPDHRSSDSPARRWRRRLPAARYPRAVPANVPVARARAGLDASHVAAMNGDNIRSRVQAARGGKRRSSSGGQCQRCRACHRRESDVSDDIHDGLPVFSLCSPARGNGAAGVRQHISHEAEVGSRSTSKERHKSQLVPEPGGSNEFDVRVFESVPTSPPHPTADELRFIRWNCAIVSLEWR